MWSANTLTLPAPKELGVNDYDESVPHFAFLSDSLNQDPSLPRVRWHRKVNTSVNDATSYGLILPLSKTRLAVMPAMQSQ